MDAPFYVRTLVAEDGGYWNDAYGAVIPTHFAIATLEPDEMYFIDTDRTEIEEAVKRLNSLWSRPAEARV